jgi:hypothetical protein
VVEIPLDELELIEEMAGLSMPAALIAAKDTTRSPERRSSSRARRCSSFVGTC